MKKQRKNIVNILQYYEEILPGYRREMPEEFRKLAQLIEQDQFELLTDSFRLVYLMNDAVESFLVFENARMTGYYDPKYEGELEASLEEEKGGYALIVRQGETVFTIFFEKLSMEVHLYNYGETGHFWVQGYEYLRQIEYKIAILRDKYRYLGAEFCNEKEQKLASLADFPPLNYCCYPAVPAKYLVTDGNDWRVTEEALQVMLSVTRASGDKRLERVLRHYRRFPGKRNAKKIARMLHRNAHSETVDLLEKYLREAASEYENRSFGEEADGKYRAILEQAEARQRELKKLGIESRILREEPFVYAKDSIEFHVYLMIWDKGILNRKVKIEVIIQQGRF